MGAYKDLDIMVQNVSMNPEGYDLNKELVTDYLSGDIKLLPPCLQDVLYVWEQECYENNEVEMHTCK